MNVWLAMGTCVLVQWSSFHPPRLPEPEARLEQTTSDREDETTKDGELLVKVVRAPVSPVVRPGAEQDEEQAVEGAQIRIATLDGDDVEKGKTDGEGKLSLELAPGKYRVELVSRDPMEFTKDLPKEITIEEGKKTRLRVVIDSGIR